MLIANLSKTITILPINTETIIRKEALFFSKDLIGSNIPSLTLAEFSMYAPNNVINTPIIANMLGLSERGGNKATNKVKMGPNET